MRSLHVMSLLLGIMLLSGCESSSENSGSDAATSSSSSVDLWEYLVPKSSVTYTFDKVQLSDDVIYKDEKGYLTHSYSVVSNSEVVGPWRFFDGNYSYSLEGSDIQYEGIKDENSQASAIGLIPQKGAIGKELYLSQGGYGYSDTLGNVTKKFYSEPKMCKISALYESKELYSGYTYSNLLEVKCEELWQQTYIEDDVVTEINGTNYYYEYYQKGVGWIGKVDTNCVVKTIGSYEFTDDSNSSCLTTYGINMLKSI